MFDHPQGSYEHDLFLLKFGEVIGCLFKGVTWARRVVPKRYIPSSDGDVHLGLASGGKRLGPQIGSLSCGS